MTIYTATFLDKDSYRRILEHERVAHAFRTGKPFHHTKFVLTGFSSGRQLSQKRFGINLMVERWVGPQPKQPRVYNGQQVCSRLAKGYEMISAEQASRSPCLQSSTDLAIPNIATRR